MISFNKKGKNSLYESRVYKLDRKDNEFTSKQFHHIRKDTTNKKILDSLSKIGTCLNTKKTTDVKTENLNKVCFVLINSLQIENKSYEVGPLNDGYLICLQHYRLGFKVFYLFNPESIQYLKFLEFFMMFTKIELTVFYSGPDLSSFGVEGIEFSNGSLTKDSIGKIIAHNCSGNARILFITDCRGGGSVFDINSCNHQKNAKPSNMISFYVNKSESPESKESLLSHGIFTYYFCKIISKNPEITPDKLVDMMNPSLSRFNEVFRCEITNNELVDSRILFID